MDTMPIKTLNTLLRIVVEQGYPLDRALQEIDLDFNPLLATETRQKVPATCYSKLYRLVMELLRDEAFGLGREFHSPPGTFRMMCLFIIHCQTLEMALKRAAEFFDYCDQYRQVKKVESRPPIIYLPDDNVLCQFQGSSQGDSNDPKLVVQANILLMMYRFYSWLIGRDLPLKEVWLKSDNTTSTAHYERLFSCPVRFSQELPGLVFSASLLQYPLTQNEDSLRDFLRQTPYQLVKHKGANQLKTLSYKIEQFFTQHANDRLPTAEHVAQHLHLSTRTLHRKLSSENNSFQKIKDNYRKELAIHYANRPELTIEAISTLMGFQDNSAFYRSFKKWTGESPGKYRQRLLQDQVSNVPE